MHIKAKFEVESKVDKGSEFILRMPISEHQAKNNK